MIWWHCCVICSCFPASLSLSLSVKQGASHSFSPTRNTHTQLTSQKPAVGRRGICALMDRQRSHLENRGCILSSCLANTQLYMADTIEQREGLEWKATETVFFVFAQEWFIVVPRSVNPVLGYYFYRRFPPIYSMSSVTIVDHLVVSLCVSFILIC